MNTDNTIPLLTDIIQLGDVDMKNHFDGHALDEATDNLNETFEINEELEIQDDIPAIHVDTETDTAMDHLQINPLEDNADDTPEVLELPLEDTDKTDQDIQPEDTTQNTLNKDELAETVNLLVSDAVDAILPIIEGQLKQSISEQIIQKLSRKLD